MAEKKKNTSKESKKEVPFEENDGMSVGKVQKVNEPLPSGYTEALKDLQQQVADLKANQSAVSTALKKEGVEYENLSLIHI